MRHGIHQYYKICTCSSDRLPCVRIKSIIWRLCPEMFLILIFATYTRELNYYYTHTEESKDLTDHNTDLIV